MKQSHCFVTLVLTPQQICHQLQFLFMKEQTRHYPPPRLELLLKSCGCATLNKNAACYTTEAETSCVWGRIFAQCCSQQSQVSHFIILR